MAAAGARSGRELTVLTPAVRKAPSFPRWAAYAWVAIVLLALVNPTRLGGFASSLQRFLVVGVLVPAVALGAWLEEIVFVKLTGRAAGLRALVALLAPFAFAVSAGLGAALLGAILGALGDGGVAAVGVAAGLLWAASAAAGTLVVVLIDIVLSALVQDFRRRIQFAVLLLVGLSAVAAGLTATAVGSLPKAASVIGASVTLNAQELRGSELERALGDPALLQLISLLLVVAAVILSLPAVMSACGKLADAVMERLFPLTRALESVGSGDLGVRVEEAGSRDFRILNRAFNQMVEQLSLSRNMERAFGQYVSGQVLHRIREQHGEATLPAELREASVFFADVRGFTSMSEKLEPAQVLGVLNRYFERVVAVIDEHEGYLDKFIGDAVVVVFNGPIDQPDHAERAVRCAIAVQREVARLNQDRAFPEVNELCVGVGVSTGPLVAGNLGSSRHMEYTVIGDTVNLAARLTSQAPAGEVWVNARNAESLPEGMFRQRLEPFTVKGKAQPVAAYRVWPPPGASLPPRSAEVSSLPPVSA